MNNRLFTAISIPANTIKTLEIVRPPKSHGIYFTNTDKLHLTLNFIGDAEIDIVRKSISEIGFSSFEITIDHVGKFSTKNGGSIFWAGIKTNDRLLQLQKEIATRLSQNSVIYDSRDYKPHITLARSKAHISESIINSFLRQQLPKTHLSFQVGEFHLFNSKLIERQSMYACLQSVNARSKV
ncbi:MAG: RNA 2',3'-cyclic phosphodiesterase [Gammaproteobacteria bacterium]|nr:MAG: RNA 2',3'-cyclic phosphodiesterase [Gammaproteobacteria bacterium]